MFAVGNAERNILNQRLFSPFECFRRFIRRHARNINARNGDARVKCSGTDDALAQSFISVAFDLEKKDNTAYDEHGCEHNQPDFQLFSAGRRFVFGCNFSHFAGYLIILKIILFEISRGSAQRAAFCSIIIARQGGCKGHCGRKRRTNRKLTLRKQVGTWA